ncbi:MAG: prenyltransferase/squalene oxidase repeat-containing protein [Planctomycetaceae bacterium]
MTVPETSRLADCFERASARLLAERNASGVWTGELSTSALSTATAVMALQMVERAGGRSFASLIDGGLTWLAKHQQADGGWGDTVKSISNISTTMLARASFHAAGADEQFRSIVDAADSYIDRVGGIDAVLRRYGKDKTFSIPILTHCALAGLVDWEDVLPLPFELACLPARFYKTVRLPVVSYALPALIAIGQVRFHHGMPRNPLVRLVRKSAVRRSLKVLERIQPTSGGFLEAAPLTSFVTMSLAAMGLAGHPVACKGVEFLVNSVRDDGSWPIDTNLATWVTTLSVNALGEELPSEARPAIRDWLLGQQYREVHPYTNADPGGWAWTDLPGGVPDADDTSGAILALLNLRHDIAPQWVDKAEHIALAAGVRWLLDLQNRDGGWPTFCPGWGTLPFDRSAPDISAHVIRALRAWCDDVHGLHSGPLQSRARKAIAKCFRYLAKTQRPDGSWLPLWFGNQFAPDDENPTYGTARVLAAYRDAGELGSSSAQRGVRCLLSAQNIDGGWGGAARIVSSVEETALAVETLLSAMPDDPRTRSGLEWLLQSVEAGTDAETAPIGFYFAKLWYFEKLYPQVFTVSALRRAIRHARQNGTLGESGPLYRASTIDGLLVAVAKRDP